MSDEKKTVTEADVAGMEARVFDSLNRALSSIYGDSDPLKQSQRAATAARLAEAFAALRGARKEGL